MLRILYTEPFDHCTLPCTAGDHEGSGLSLIPNHLLAVLVHSWLQDVWAFSSFGQETQGDIDCKLLSLAAYRDSALVQLACRNPGPNA